ncbi:MAG: DUF2490 domain-containing protein [Muriicola sp.]
MITSFIKGLFLATVILWYSTARAQEDYIVYLQPQFSMNYKVAPYYYHNFSLSSRNFIFQNENLQFEGRHLDLSHFSTFKTGVGTSFAAGLLYRFRESFDASMDNEIRFTQQFNVTTSPYKVRYGHRIRMEQRIVPTSTTHRFRYRFALDVPLAGEKVDLKEAYLILNTEALLSVARGISPQLDQRISATIGWLLTEQLQLQTGLEHRWENYTRLTQPVLFLTSTLIFSL